MTMPSAIPPEISAAVREAYKYTPLERLLPAEYIVHERQAAEGHFPVSDFLPNVLADAAQTFADPLLEYVTSFVNKRPLSLIPPSGTFPEQPYLPGTSRETDAFILDFSEKHSFHHFRITIRETEAPSVLVFYGNIKSGQAARLIMDIESLSHRVASVIMILRAEENSEAEINLLLGGHGTLRTNIYGLLDGKGAQLRLHGALVSGAGAHHDVHAVIRHLEPDTASRQKLRMIGTRQSVSVFTGRIQVEPQASGTEAYQSARGIAMSEEAVLYARPFLEILNDNVRCSHGCTTGHLDEEQVFYLRSRGVPEQEARRLLAEAFMFDTFQEAYPGAFRDLLISTLKTRLESCIW